MSSTLPEDEKVAGQLKRKMARDRLTLAMRQGLRVLPVLAVAALAMTFVYHRAGGRWLAAAWLACFVLQALLFLQCARRFFLIGPTARNNDVLRDFRNWNCFFAVLHVAIWCCFTHVAFDTWSLSWQVGASVMALLTLNWFGFTGALLPVSYWVALALLLVSLSSTWWQSYEWRSLPMIAAASTIAAAAYWMHRGQELLFKRLILLKTRNEHLIEEMAQRNQIIESINRKKTEVIAAASHDLRQPIHALGLLVQRLRPSLVEDGQRQHEQISLFGQVRARVTVLSEMLSGLLDLTKLDSGSYRVSLEWIKLRDVLEEALASFGEQANRKGVTLNCECPDVDIYTDRTLFKQIVYNLLSNAVKYTPAGDVTVVGAMQRDYFALQFRDTGMGIPTSKLGEIFMEYFRLAATRDTIEGLGIGLTIVRRAMKLLDYGISVRSQLGAGSTFKLKVPLNRVSRDSVPAVSTLDTNPADLDFNSTYTVLVLENDAVANDAMVRVMSDWGYRVMAATSGEMLLRELQQGSQGIVDLIVSDLRLGESHDGLEYIEKVRGLLASPRLPAILLTGDLGREIQLQAAQMGVHVLYKPLRPPQLRIALRNALIGRN